MRVSLPEPGEVVLNGSDVHHCEVALFCPAPGQVAGHPQVQVLGAYLNLKGVAGLHPECGLGRRTKEDAIVGQGREAIRALAGL